MFLFYKHLCNTFFQRHVGAPQVAVVKINPRKMPKILMGLEPTCVLLVISKGGHSLKAPEQGKVK